MIQILLIKNDLSQPEIGYMEYKDVTETIIGCAYRVYNKIRENL